MLMKAQGCLRGRATSPQAGALKLDESQKIKAKEIRGISGASQKIKAKEIRKISDVSQKIRARKQ